MTYAIHSPNELSLTTTSLAVLPILLDAPRARSAKQYMVIVDVDRFALGRIHSDVRDSMNIDDYVAELERDPEWADDLKRGRMELAQQMKGVRSLAAMRLSRGLSQRELAQRIGASQPQIARLEQGKGNPGVATLRKLADELGVRIDEALLAFEKQHAP